MFWRIRLGALHGEAIILRTYPLKETDKLIVLFSQEHGKIRGVVNGGQRIKSRFSGKLEPLSWIEFSGFQRRNQQLVSIDSIEVIKGFGLILEDYHTFLRSAYLLEIILKTMPDREVNQNVFRLLLHVLPAFVKIDTSEAALLYFQVWYLKFGGFFPDLYKCCKCGNSLAKKGRVYCEEKNQGFMCGACTFGIGRQISVENMELFKLLTKMSLVELLKGNQISKNINHLSTIVEELIETSFERKFDTLSVIKQGV